MNALMQSLLQLATRGGQLTADQARAIWRRLCIIVAGLLFACFIVFVANTVFGWHGPALFLAITFVLAAAFAWTKPLFFLCVGIAGMAEKLATHATLAESLKDVFRVYAGLFKWSVVAVVFYCFAMWLISFDENSSMAVTALFALAVVGLCLWAWPDLFPGAWARKTVYWGSVIVVICGLLSQIPAPYWIKYVGWAPSFAPTVAENMISDIRQAQQANKEKSDAELLVDIRKKVRRGETLTAAEESLVTRKEAEAKTMKALAGSVANTLSSPDPSPSLSTVDGTIKKYWLWIALILGVLYFVSGAVAKPWTKAVQGMTMAVAVVLAGVLVANLFWGEKPAEKVMTLTAPPNGDSPSISGPNGHIVAFEGKGFVMHCIYNDDRDEAYPCSTGKGLIKQYVHDTSGKQNTVTYKFVRPK